MSLIDFLWGNKKSWKYDYREEPKKQQTITKREPTKENTQEPEKPIKDYERMQREQIYGRRIETDSSLQTFKGEFYTFKKPIYKDVVVLVIENSVFTREYSEKILQIAKKIIESNKESFFLFIRTGDDKKTYFSLNSDFLEKEKIIDNWFSKINAQECNYLEVMSFIDKYYKSIITGIELQDIHDKESQKYFIQNINIVFIGSGTTTLEKEDKKEFMRLLKSLKNKTTIKSIKYFCVLDSQTINVAKLGFPVIGHIETDFYK